LKVETKPAASFTPPAPAKPAPQPVAAQAQPAADLFQPHHSFDADQDEAEMAADEVPAPAYRPQPAQLRQPAATQSLDADAGSFVAPRPRAAGSPSPEALARLQAAVSKSPAPQPAPRAPMQQRQPVAEPAPKPAERPRFGIGSLINRMAGGQSEAAQERATPARQQPPVTSYDDEPELSADQERIEIPAFLRRQAN
jgi:cell division protein FtsZ